VCVRALNFFLQSFFLQRKGLYKVTELFFQVKGLYKVGPPCETK
jgi:hypothetical protein